MKTYRIIFWISTALISAMMLMSAVMYLSHNEEVTSGFTTMGYPLFLINILATAKILGALALLQPWLPRLREWAYAGFTINFIGAIWSHAAIHDSFIKVFIPLVLLGVSYVMFRIIESRRKITTS